jgi:hypothetical protein
MSLAKEYLTAPKEAEPCIGRERGGIFGAAPGDTGHYRYLALRASVSD